MDNRARSNLFMSTTLVSFLMAAAFKFDADGIHWFWADKSGVAIGLIVLGCVLGMFWIRSRKPLRQD
jgi:hypothetical protein